MPDYSDIFPDLSPEQTNKLIADQLKSGSAQMPITKPADAGSAGGDLWPWLAAPAIGGAAKVAGTALAKSLPAILKMVPRPGTTFNTTTYDLLNEGAGKVGKMKLRYDPETKDLYVHDIASRLPAKYDKESVPGIANDASWTLGPENLNSIREQTLKLYPEAQTVSGRRISGVRAGPYGSAGEITRQIPGREPPMNHDTFHELGQLQRGRPENAMLTVQNTNGGGVLNPVVEHAGDLVHRMTNLAPRNYYGYHEVKDKVDKVLRYLKNPYGFEREFNGNIVNNARAQGVSEDFLRNQVDRSLKMFGREHGRLPAYNDAHRTANEINTHIGNKNWEGAIKGLEKLKSKLGSQEEWNAYASQGLKTE